MWASVWRKTIPHDGNIFAAFVDRRLHHCDDNAPSLLLHDAPLEAAWRTSRHCGRGRENLPLVHTLFVQLRLQPHHPDVPAGPAQEPGSRVAIGDIVRVPFGALLDFRIQA